MIRITEGVIKADIATAITHQLTVGLPGVSNYRLAKKELDKWKPEHVIIAFDSDFRTNRNVAHALVNAVRFYSQDYAVSVETWWSDDGKGIDDLLAADKQPDCCSAAQLEDLLLRLERRFGRLDEQRKLPTILISLCEHEVNDRAVAALAYDGAIFHRGGVLVHIISGSDRPAGICRPPESPRIAALPHATLRERLTRVPFALGGGSAGDGVCRLWSPGRSGGTRPNRDAHRTRRPPAAPGASESGDRGRPGRARPFLRAGRLVGQDHVGLGWVLFASWP